MLMLAIAFVVLQAHPFTTTEAKAHVGQEATVCGKVATARWASNSQGKPTFLNLDAAYPKQLFTVVIFGTDRPKFAPPPEQQFKDKKICVTGKIEDFHGTPQIAVKEPKQIAIRAADGKR